MTDAGRRADGGDAVSALGNEMASRVKSNPSILLLGLTMHFGSHSGRSIQYS
jgi:hypothetical protein